MSEYTPKDVVQIHGTDYTVIAARLRKFREDHPDWTITTKILSDGQIVRVKATVRNENGRKIATGHAEEDRDVGNINKTSAVENTETSAVGRALGWVSGEYAGSAIRSGDEMLDALFQQKAQEYIQYMDLVREHWDTINAAKEFLIPRYGPNENQPNVSAAREVLEDLSDEVKLALWKAPTKGGVFTTHERTILKVKPEDAL